MGANLELVVSTEVPDHLTFNVAKRFVNEIILPFYIRYTYYCTNTTTTTTNITLIISSISPNANVYLLFSLLFLFCLFVWSIRSSKYINVIFIFDWFQETQENLTKTAQGAEKWKSNYEEHKMDKIENRK